MVLSVQYMRAIAALLVVFHHCAWKARQYSTDPWGWIAVGECGVNLFFIISGYIVVLVTLGRWLPHDRIALMFVTHPLLLEFAIGIAAYWVLSKAAWNIVGQSRNATNAARAEWSSSARATCRWKRRPARAMRAATAKCTTCIEGNIA